MSLDSSEILLIPSILETSLTSEYSSSNGGGEVIYFKMLPNEQVQECTVNDG